MFEKIISHLIYLNNYKKSKGTSRLYKQGGEQMKIQYIAIIFLLIALPILLVVSYYMGLQIDTITLQTTYNTKLLASTKEALEAFEINTVEWNSKYSDVANSRRRNVEAAINTFTRSLANNLGISGANKEYLEAYLPAVLCTMYDGYYIYTPTDMKETVKDENGQDVVYYDKEEINDRIVLNGGVSKPAEGSVLYKVASGKPKDGKYTDIDGKQTNFTKNADNAVEKKEHTLLPYVEYSEQIGDITVAYTLDNYIKVYGDLICYENYSNYGGDKVKDLGKGAGYRINTTAYVKEEGHLVYNEYNMQKKKLDSIYYWYYGENKESSSRIETKINPEYLSENVTYKEGSNYVTEKFNYIYVEDSQGDKSKLYYDDSPVGTNNWFTIDSKDGRTFLTDSITNVTQYVYKKVSLPGQGETYNGTSTEHRYINFYQVLNGTEKDNWYADWNDDGELTPSERVTNLSTYQLDQIDRKQDCSAVKYYVQAYYFTNWINHLASQNVFTTGTDNLGFSYKNDIFKTSKTSDPGNPKIAKDSALYQHKNQIIQNKIMDSLAQAIYYYEGSSGQLPNPTGEEWEQILSNVSMVSFMQGVPIGLKTYNSYAIATSTNNREYVDPNEIYFINKTDTEYKDEYYHRCYCSKTLKGSSSTIIGYKSVDFVERNYEDTSNKTKYYFLHNIDKNGIYNNVTITNNTRASMACYYCLVNRSIIEKVQETSDTSDDYLEDIYKNAYDTALARERYRANQDVILAKEYAEFEVEKRAAVAYKPDGTKRCDLSTGYGDDKIISTAYAMIGDTVAWEIRIKNVGAAAGKIKMYDKIPDGLIYESFAESGTSIGYSGGYDASTDSINITTNNIPAGGEMKVIVRTKVNKLGTLYNTVILHDEGGIDDIDSAFAKTKAEKTITITKDGSGRNANVIFVLDQSTSMSIRRH